MHFYVKFLSVNWSPTHTLISSNSWCTCTRVNSNLHVQVRDQLLDGTSYQKLYIFTKDKFLNVSFYTERRVAFYKALSTKLRVIHWNPVTMLC